LLSRSVMLLLPTAIPAALMVALALGGCDNRPPAPEQANAAAPSSEVAPDEVTAAPVAPRAGFDRSHRGEAAPAAAFTDLDGKPATLAGFRGKPVLVNLWATWCAPCVKELPTLDRAAESIRVVAISQDMDGAAKVRPFLEQRKLARVEPYLDPKLSVGTAFAANLPVTILYDAAGKEVWRRTGDFDWASLEAAKAMAEAG